MSAYTQLSVTTSAGTTTVQLGNENTITIDSPGGPPGTPAASIRTPHTFTGFLQYGAFKDLYSASKAYPAAFRRVGGLSYAAGAVTVTEAGAKEFESQPDPWTRATAVTVDNSSSLVIDGHGIAARQNISLNGLSAISLTEAA